MPAARRVLPLAFCLMSAIGSNPTQAAESFRRVQGSEAVQSLPPIFAPRAVAKESAVTVTLPRTPNPEKAATTRMRAQLSEAILAIALAMPVPDASASEAEAQPASTAEGVVLMKRFLVKSVAPGESEVSPPPALRLLHFAPMERAARRTKPAWQMPLLHLMGGYLHLDVVNGAGQGADHGRDFTRVEFGFTRPF